MGSSLGHLTTYMMDFIKNGSQIKILKIQQILMKISKYSILDHIDNQFSMYCQAQLQLQLQLS